MNNKDKYRKLCEKDKTVPIFSQPWWLDTVCAGTDNWDVVIFEKGGQLLGALPYFVKRKYGFTILTSPKLTQTLGVWLAPSKTKYANKLKKEKEIMQGLISSLPKYHIFFQSFHNSITNWLPFYWKGFEQTTKYTYVIEDLTNIDSVWNATNPNIKTDVRKARKILEVVSDISFEEFYRVISLTYKRQNLEITYSFDFLKKVFDETLKHDSGKIFCAVDAQGNTHAVVFLIWDENTAYYLIGGADPELRNSGAASLCVWEAIKFSATVSQTFDFEGSMVEGIERFFRGFGAKQKPYSRIMKFNSIFFGLYYYLRRYRNGKI